MRGKVESKIVRNLAMRSKVESPVNDSNGLLDELWAKIVGASDWSDWICQLHAHFGCKEAQRRTTCAKNDQAISILQVIQRPICFGNCEKH